MTRPTDFVDNGGILYKKTVDFDGDESWTEATIEELLTCAKDESTRLEVALRNVERIESRLRESEAFRSGVELVFKIISEMR